MIVADTEKTEQKYIESRIINGAMTVAQRDDGEGEGKGKKMLRGYAARFNVVANLHWFDEEILPGAFSESIEKDDIRALVNHDANLILGRNKVKTLTLTEDSKGLYSEIDPPNTSAANDIIISVERGDIDGMSFQFIVEEEKWIYSEEKNSLRQIVKASLRDVSIVTFPAYEITDVSYRDASGKVFEMRSIESVFHNRKMNPAPKLRENYMGLLKRYTNHCKLCN